MRYVDFIELDDQQGRYLRGAATAWRRYLAAEDDRSEVSGALAWKKVKGREYLVRSWYDRDAGTKRGTSLGVRSPETEKVKADFERRRAVADQALEEAKAPLDRISRVAKALRLGRMDNTGADILRELRREGVLGPGLYAVDFSVVAGYEAQTGVFLPHELGSEPDRLELRTTAAEVDDAMLDDLAKACRRVDASFAWDEDVVGITNGRFKVTLNTRQNTLNWLRRSGEFDRDQLDILTRAAEDRPIRTVAIAKNGMPVEIVSPDPRNFALMHYASKIVGIEPGKNRAYAVGRLVEMHWPEKFPTSALEAFPDFAAHVAPGRLRAQDPQVDDPEVEDPDAEGPGGMRFYGP